MEKLELYHIEEEWRDVKGYEGKYMVSNIGRILSKGRSIRTGTGHRLTKDLVMTNMLSRYGYPTILLSDTSGKKLKTIHRLVASAFIPNPDNKPCVDHINTIKLDNRVGNLRWATHKENVLNTVTRKKKSDTFNSKINAGEWVNKPVNQIDLVSGNIVSSFISIKEAMRVTGIDNTLIGKCAKGIFRTAGGYGWEFNYNYRYDKTY